MTDAPLPQAEPRDEMDLPPLPAHLWPRLAAAQRRRHQLLRNGLRSAGLAAVLVVAAGAALLLDLPGGDSAPPPGDILADSAGELPVQAQIAAIDLALEAAYHRSAADEELAPLWQLRSRLLATHLRPDTRNL